MTTIRLSGFAGENRALHPLILDDGVGVTSTNQKPGRGDLRPWKAPLTVATVPAGRKTIYRMGRDAPQDANYWLSWTTHVHAVRGPNATDTAERTYFTGSGTPKWTNTTLALASTPYPTATRELGVPAPSGSVMLSASGGATQIPAGPARTETMAPRVISTLEITYGPGLLYQWTRSILITTVTPHGLQSGSEVTIGSSTHPQINASGMQVAVISANQFRYSPSDMPDILAPVACTGTVAASTDSVNYPAVPAIGEEPIINRRAYTYTYVSDIGEEGSPQPNPTAITCAADATVTIAGLNPPPSGNYGINRIRIYRTQSDSAGKGEFYFLREIASTLTTTTDDNRDLGEVMPTTTWLPPPADLKFLTGLWNGMMAGISGRSVRFCEAYVPYAWPFAYEVLPTGTTPVALATFGQTLVMLTDGNPSFITGGTPDAMDEQPIEWSQACVAPLSAVGMGHGVAWAAPDGLAYVGQGGPRLLTQGILTRDDWQALKPCTLIGSMYDGRYFGFFNDGSRKAFMLDPANPGGMYFMDFGVDALYLDDMQDALYVLDGVSVKKWDAGTPLATTFKSKVFKMPKPTVGFACAEVTADAYPVTFKLYADGALKHTQTVASRTPFRLPGGYYADQFQIEVSTTGAIQGVVVAHSMQELAQT